MHITPHKKKTRFPCAAQTIEKIQPLQARRASEETVRRWPPFRGRSRAGQALDKAEKSPVDPSRRGALLYPFKSPRQDPPPNRPSLTIPIYQNPIPSVCRYFVQNAGTQSFLPRMEWLWFPGEGGVVVRTGAGSPGRSGCSKLPFRCGPATSWAPRRSWWGGMASDFHQVEKATEGEMEKNCEPIRSQEQFEEEDQDEESKSEDTIAEAKRSKGSPRYHLRGTVPKGNCGCPGRAHHVSNFVLQLPACSDFVIDRIRHNESPIADNTHLSKSHTFRVPLFCPECGHGIIFSNR